MTTMWATELDLYPSEKLFEQDTFMQLVTDRSREDKPNTVNYTELSKHTSSG